MKRAISVGIAAVAMVVAGLAGCSSNKSNTTASTEKVTIDGQNQNITGQVSCTQAGGNLNIGIGDPTAKGENRVDLDALQRIASATGGRSFRGENREQLAGIYALLDRVTPSKVKHSVYRPKVKLYYVPLGAALLLMIAYHLVMLGVFAPLARRRDVSPSPGTSES